MEWETINPGGWLSVAFAAPRARRARVEVTIDVTEGGPVDVWAMPEDQLDRFSDGRMVEYYERLRRVTEGSLRFTPDRGEDWVLVIDNVGAVRVEVGYEVEW
jgi:hypothetical protein